MNNLSPKRGPETRARLLEVAEQSVLAKGFAATSIDELIAAVGITKSGFFYHFKGKGELAEALLQRYIDNEDDLPEGHPGCLVASYCYQENLFSKDIRALNKEAVLGWRARFRTRFDLIAARHPPKIDVDLDALADMVSVLVDGGIIVSKVVHDKRVLPQQIMLLRDYVRVIFLGT